MLTPFDPQQFLDYSNERPEEHFVGVTDEGVLCDEQAGYLYQSLGACRTCNNFRREGSIMTLLPV